MQKRIVISALLSVTAMLVTLGIISSISVRSEIDHALDQSLELATVAANYTDHLLRSNLARLYDVSLSGVVNLEDGNWEPEREALERAYEYSIFADGLFILDSKARIVLSHPFAQVGERDLIGIPDVKKAYEQAKPFFTKVHTLAETGRRAMFAFAPLKSAEGRTVGVIGGEIDPTTHFLRNTVRSLPEESNTVIELIDEDGIVIASSHPERVFSCSDRSRFMGDLITTGEKEVFQCHRCHISEQTGEVDNAAVTTDILAFAPLQEAPWGVAVREPEEDIFAPSDDLRRRFLWLGFVVIVSAVVLSFAISRSVVNPIQDLTRAATRIAGGHLEQPIRVRSKDEVGALAESFETMRQQLAATLDDLRKTNLELEGRVEDRTQQLRQSRRRLANLLGKVMSAQEEERKRIARELHDETLQATAAVGLRLEIAAMSLEKSQLSPEKLLQLKKNVDQLIDGINLIIQDLRPPMLDDLGLDSALRWLLNKRLSDRKIQFQLDISDEFKERLESLSAASPDQKPELIVFRIIQEAVTNIAKHAKASLVTVSLSSENQHLIVKVEDDGVGFDADSFLADAGRRGSAGFGILGIRERAALLGGTFEVFSRPGEGATVTVTIPLTMEETDASH